MGGYRAGIHEDITMSENVVSISLRQRSICTWESGWACGEDYKEHECGKLGAYMDNTQITIVWPSVWAQAGILEELSVEVDSVARIGVVQDLTLNVWHQLQKLTQWS